jgi:hypothetical protein
MGILEYSSTKAKPPPFPWLQGLFSLTAVDLALNYSLARHIVLEASWGRIGGFYGYERPAILVCTMFNALAFLLTLVVMFLHPDRRRWWVLLCWPVQAYIVLFFMTMAWGL